MSLVQLDPKPMARRAFLSACAACAAAPLCRAKSVDPALPEKDRLRLRVVFTHREPSLATWPYQGYDYEGRKTEILNRLRAACPNVNFLPATARDENQAKEILKSDAEVDGYLVSMIGLWTRAPQAIAAQGKPTIFADDLYAGSGEFLVAYAAARRAGLKVAPVSSSRFEDTVMAVRAMGVLKQLRSMTILDATDRDISAGAKVVNEVYGATVKRIDGAAITAAYRKASAEEGQRYARKWAREAVKVVEPTEQTLNDSGRMYVAMRNLLQEHNTPAITVDCLTLFYAGKLPAYPCLGFFQLNNDAKIGACEGDLPSTLSMVLMTGLTGRPGYISDPVIDTSKNQIIYAHCVSTNRVFGPEGPANPYYIRDHSEDRKGAAVRSVMPVGEMTTTLRFDAGKKAMIIHQGKSVDNIEEDKACRSKLAVEVKDTDKLMSEWDKWGWHRVTFYGDLKPQAYTLARLLGFQIVEEG